MHWLMKQRLRSHLSESIREARRQRAAGAQHPKTFAPPAGRRARSRPQNRASSPRCNPSAPPAWWATWGCSPGSQRWCESAARVVSTHLWVAEPISPVIRPTQQHTFVPDHKQTWVLMACRAGSPADEHTQQQRAAGSEETGGIGPQYGTRQSSDCTTAATWWRRAATRTAAAVSDGGHCSVAPSPSAAVTCSSRQADSL